MYVSTASVDPTGIWYDTFEHQHTYIDGGWTVGGGGDVYFWSVRWCRW